MTQDEAKLEAARAALAELPEAGVVGLGSGSTAKLVIGAVEPRQTSAGVRGIPTVEGSRRQLGGARESRFCLTMRRGRST